MVCRDGLRPTTDRARETLFNWLAPVLHGARCIDLFAGSGALGLEAASRGAARVLLIERDRQLAESLRGSVARLAADNVEVRCADAVAELARGSPVACDIAFVDPPFDAGLWPAVFGQLPRWLSPDAWIYVEAPEGRLPDPPADWQLHRESATRDVRHVLFRRPGADG